MTKQFNKKLNALIEENLDKIKKVGAKYVAVDPSGSTWSYISKPIAGVYDWESHEPTGSCFCLGNIDFDSTNWKKTLIKLEDIERDGLEIVEGSVNNTPKAAMLIPTYYDQVKESIDGDDDKNKKLPWGDPNKGERLIRFKLWKVGNKSVVWKMLAMTNLSTLHKQPKKLISKSLLDFRNIEGCFTFPSKEIRKQSIESAIKELKSIVHYREIATKNHIGKEVNTSAGIAQLVNITIDGKYVVTYPEFGPKLVIVNNATILDGLIPVFSEEPNQADGSTLYEIYMIKA